jgi:redox-sensitive bicupin YhaK (pirin superfamily)
MITLRRSADRGHANHGWLDTRHTFSFADYHDPAHMGFRALRVINEDVVRPGHGFGTHPHRDMEILTYVLAGAVEHRDSMGNGSVIRPGEVQRMTAGTGVTHSERNPSPSEPLHLLQIWILPEQRGLEPSYEQCAFPLAKRRGQLRLVASRDARAGSLRVHQDVDVFAAHLAAADRVSHGLAPGRAAWLQVARGSLTLNSYELHAGDGAAITDEARVDLIATKPAEVLLFDLA